MVHRMRKWEKFGKFGWVKKGKDRLNPHLSGGKVVSVFPIGGEWEKGGWVKKSGYIVEIDESGYNLLKKKFKTKHEAIKFAKGKMKNW